MNEKHESCNNRFILGSEFCKQPPVSNSIIRGILDADSLSTWWGDSEAGKSFLALDRDLHIAHGIKWRGHKTRKGFVLYIIGEGKNGMIRRVKAWHEYHGLPISDNIAFSIIPSALCQPESVNELIIDIQKLIKETGKNPTLIELDTLNRNFGQGDENSTKDMTAFVAGMDTLRRSTGAAISTVHHCGHGAKDRGRGSIVLHTNVDFEFKVSKSGNCLDEYCTTMEFIKVKDYDKPAPLSWSWKIQSLPWMEYDDDDNLIPVNSVVLLPTDFIPSDVGDKQQSALNALKQLYQAQRQTLTDGGQDPSTALVKMADWKKAMISTDSDKSNRSRTRDSLIQRKIVEVIANEYVKPT